MASSPATSGATTPRLNESSSSSSSWAPVDQDGLLLPPLSGQSRPGPSMPASPVVGTPLFSKRARQIQQESGVNLARYRPPALRDSLSPSSDHIRELFNDPSMFTNQSSEETPGDASSAPARGRARAGTLPSSWNRPAPKPARPTEVAAMTTRSRFAPSTLTAEMYAGPHNPVGRNAMAVTDAEVGPGTDGHDVPGFAADSHLARLRSSSNASFQSIGPPNFMTPNLATRNQAFQPRTPSLASTNTSSFSDSPSQSSVGPSRIRSGSLASEKHLDLYGGAFSPWLDTSPDLDNGRNSMQRPSKADIAPPPVRGRGATIANPPGLRPFTGVSEGDADDGLRESGSSSALGRFEADDFKTLEFLSLNEGTTLGEPASLPPSEATAPAAVFQGPGTFLSGRERASTLADDPHRPRSSVNLTTVSGRARGSSTLAPGAFAFYTPDLRSEHHPAVQVSHPVDLASHHHHPLPHGGLANASLQQRLGEDFSSPQMRADSADTAAGRARAISLSMMDTKRTPSHFPSVANGTPPLTGAVPDAVSQEDLYAYAYENGLDPAAFAEAAASAGVNVIAKPLSTPSLSTRARAGTIATFTGRDRRSWGEQDAFTPLHEQAPLSASDLEMASPWGPSDVPNSHSPVANGYPLGVPATSPYRNSSAPVFPGPPGNLAVPLKYPGAPTQIHHPQPHQPTRSLWVGNLDPSTTGQELMQAFARYGAIESLRLLPDKECGFVNFVEVKDAVKARDDVMGRLGGRIQVNGTGVGGSIRIGYGKIDSPHDTGAGPTTQSSARSGHRTPSGPITAGTSQQAIGMDKDDAAPTRALWIGSIPSSTTPAALLQIFSPFGPVESARVLTHKNCGFVNFERVDDAIRAKKMLSGREVLGAEVGAVRVGFAKVPGRQNDGALPTDPSSHDFALVAEQLDNLKGAAMISGEQQAYAGSSTPAIAGNGHNLDNYRSHLVVELLKRKGAEQLSAPGEPSPGSEINANGAAGSIASSLAMTHARSALHSGLSASSSIVPSSEKGGVPLPAELQPRASVTDLQLLMEKLTTKEDAANGTLEAHLSAVSRFRPPATYYTSIASANESTTKRFDTNKLRDIRKGIEQGQYSPAAIEELAASFLDSIVDLSSDYIGNTLVQKLFERCSINLQTAMLERIAPHLASIGIHKNGTWAAQKIIDTAQSPEHKALIAQHLRPYIPPLLLDQFGNYVVQCVLPYGSDPATADDHLNSSFVFDAMVDRCWEIAQGRFGARSMRACLESPHASSLQRKRVAMAVILNSVPLATSPNGTLLLTWLLDTSNLPGRFGLLAPRFTPHLAHLCTHKLASSTVLKVANQRGEADAAYALLDALFDSPQDAILEEVLSEKVHGSQFITKLLSSPHLEADRKARYSAQTRAIVEKYHYLSVPAYRRLVEDLGLAFVPHASAGRGSRPEEMQSGPTNASANATSHPVPDAPNRPGLSRRDTKSRIRSPDVDIFNPYSTRPTPLADEVPGAEDVGGSSTPRAVLDHSSQTRSSPRPTTNGVHHPVGGSFLGALPPNPLAYPPRYPQDGLQHPLLS
ncbi:unnamed protein product [Parajaminaea phylloscopi]